MGRSLTPQPSKTEVTPGYLICDPLPSEAGDRPATYILRVIEPASLWILHDDDPGEIGIYRNFEDLEKYRPEALAKIAREVGDFYLKYCQEEDL